MYEGFITYSTRVKFLHTQCCSNGKERNVSVVIMVKKFPPESDDEDEEAGESEEEEEDDVPEEADGMMHEFSYRLGMQSTNDTVKNPDNSNNSR